MLCIFQSFVALCLIAMAGYANCGLLSIPVENALVKSQNLGSSFSYSTVQTHGPSSVSSYSIAQPLYYQPFLNPQLISGQYYYPGLVSQAPGVTYPQQIFGQQPIYVQNPIFGGYPVQQPQEPIVEAPVQTPPQQEPAGSVAVDDDTISVEAA